MRVARLFVLAVIAWLVGCSSKVTGSVTSKGGPLGNFTLVPASCESGQNWSFFGVAFFVAGNSRSRVEVVQDPLRGWFVKVAKPGTDDMYIFGKEDCKVLDVDVRKTNTVNNGVTVVEGSLKFDCKQEDDGKVKGELTFSGCG